MEYEDTLSVIERVLLNKKKSTKYQIIEHLMNENYDLLVFELNKLLKINGHRLEFEQKKESKGCGCDCGK